MWTEQSQELGMKYLTKQEESLWGKRNGKYNLNLWNSFVPMQSTYKNTWICNKNLSIFKYRE